MDKLFIDLMTAKPYDSEANDFIAFLILQANIKTSKNRRIYRVIIYIWYTKFYSGLENPT